MRMFSPIPTGPGDERALVIYNNRYANTRGTIDSSAAYADKPSGHLRRQRLREGLGAAGSRLVAAWRDSLTGSITCNARSARRARPCHELHAYQSHVFLEWRETALHRRASVGPPLRRACRAWRCRSRRCPGAARTSTDARRASPAYEIPELMRNLADLADASIAPAGLQPPAPAHPGLAHPERRKAFDSLREEVLQSAGRRCREFLREAQKFLGTQGAITNGRFAAPAATEDRFRPRLRDALRIPALEAMFPTGWPIAARRVLPSHSPLGPVMSLWAPVLAWTVLEVLAESVAHSEPPTPARWGPRWRQVSGVAPDSIFLTVCACASRWLMHFRRSAWTVRTPGAPQPELKLG